MILPAWSDRQSRVKSRLRPARRLDICLPQCRYSGPFPGSLYPSAWILFVGDSPCFCTVPDVRQQGFLPISPGNRQRQNTLRPLCTGKLPVHNNVVTFHPFLLFPVLSLSSLRSGKDGIRYSVPVWHKFRFRVFADSSVTLLTDIQPFVVDE